MTYREAVDDAKRMAWLAQGMAVAVMFSEKDEDFQPEFLRFKGDLERYGYRVVRALAMPNPDGTVDA